MCTIAGLDSIKDPVFRSMVRYRLIEPSSINRIHAIASRYQLPYFGRSSYQKTLEVIDDANFTDRLTRIAFKAAKTLGELNQIHFDVTTIATETDRTDNLRKPGMSKIHSHHSQLMVAYAASAMGIPLFSLVFPGDVDESATFGPFLEQLVRFRSYLSKKTVIVADAKFATDNSVKKCVDLGFDYIFGGKTTSAKKQLDGIPYLFHRPIKGLGFVVDTIGFQKIGRSFTKELKNQRAQGHTYVGQNKCHRVLLLHTRDKHDRDLQYIQTALEKAIKVKEGTVTPKMDKYVLVSKENLQLNEKTISRAMLTKGWHVMYTSLPADVVDPLVVAAAYNRQYQIEMCFRQLKSIVGGQPVFHRNEATVRGHLIVGFAAVLVERMVSRLTGVTIKQFVDWLSAGVIVDVYVTVGTTAVLSAGTIPAAEGNKGLQKIRAALDVLDVDFGRPVWGFPGKQ